jgi:hypothetical protein
MALETFDNINIQNLALEKPESRVDLPFDPERDITGEDWRKIMKYLNNNLMRNKKLLTDVSSSLLASIKLLAPDKISPYTLDSRNWGVYKKEILESREGKGATGLTYSFNKERRAKILFPQYFSEIKLESLEITDLKNQCSGQKSSLLWQQLAETLVKFKMLAPDHFAADINTEEMWPDLLRDAQAMRETMNDLDARHRFGWYLANLKLVFPQHARELPLDSQTWRQLRDTLDYYRNESADPNAEVTFASLAKDLKILSAYWASITDKGEVEIIMKAPQEYESTSRELPEQKNF